MSGDWPNPWDWDDDHGIVVENYLGSEYDIGVDHTGNVLIHFEGHVGTVLGSRLAEIDGADNPRELIQE